MPEGQTTPLLRIEAGLASALIALAVVGLTLLPLTSAFYVRSLVSIVGAERLTGLTESGTMEAAEAVRVFVLDNDVATLPAELEGKPAFDPSAVSHLVDVRNVLVPARRVALATAALALVWLAIRRGRPRLVASALGGAAWSLLVIIGVAVLVGLTDFDAFFSWFHGLFFAPGTWVFPADALLIRVFPLPFWMTAAGTWAGLVLAACGLLFTLAHRLRFTASTYGV